MTNFQNQPLRMPRLFRVMIVLALAASLAACAQEAGQVPAPPETPAPPEAPAPPDSARAYEAVGRVVSMLPNKTFVNVDHEAIPGFMDAMTMTFPVRDTTLLRGIQPGDSIRFHFTAEAGIHAVEKIE